MAVWFAVAVLSVAAFAAAAWLRYVQSGLLAEEVRRSVASQLQESLRRDVQLGSVSGDLPHGVTLHGLLIAERGGFARGVAFSAEAVRLSFNWQSVLTVRPDIVNFIARADLTNPRLVISRTSDGAWNIEDLLTHQGAPPTARFRGQIVVTNGAVVFNDALGVASPFSVTFERVTGEAGFRRRDEGRRQQQERKPPEKQQRQQQRR